MRWDHLSVDADMEVKEGVKCAGCHHVIHDLLFYPRDYSGLEAEQVLKAAKADPRNSEIDPYAFGFCQDCKYGLDELLKENQDRRKAARIE